MSYSEDRNNYKTHVSSLTELHNSDSYTNVINPALLEFFELSTFTSSVPSIDATGITSAADVTEFLKSKNTSLSTYYDNIDNVSTDDVVANAMIKDMAVKITDYFVISSVLYKFIYGSQYSSNPTVTVDGNSDFQNVLRAYMDAADKLNLDDTQTYSDNLQTNVDMNNRFVSQDALLKLKDTTFNKEKSNVITLMSKIHKGTKAYNGKRFHQALYTFLLVVYAMLVIFVTYSMTASNFLSNKVSAAKLGPFLFISGASVFVALFVQEVIEKIKYYSK
jgi:hypothetical protein